MSIPHEFREYGFEGSAPDPIGREMLLGWLSFIREFTKNPVFPPMDRETSILDNDQLTKARRQKRLNPVKAAIEKIKIGCIGF